MSKSHRISTRRDEDGALWVERSGQRALSEWVTSRYAAKYFDGIAPETRITSSLQGHSIRITEAIQRYSDGTPAHHIKNLVMRCHADRPVRLIAYMICMDYLLEIGDRHEENWLLTDDNRVVAIDNEIGTAPDCTILESSRPAARTLLLTCEEHTPILFAHIVHKLKEINGRIGGHARTDLALAEIDLLRKESEYAACPMG